MGVKGIVFCLLIVLFTACSGDYRHNVVGDNLTVYFTDKKEETLAEKVALFWRDNKLISGEKQDLQITRTGKIVELKMIANHPESVKNMPFEERKLLADLERELQIELKEPTLQLVICTNKFEPIYRPTE